MVVPKKWHKNRLFNVLDINDENGLRAKAKELKIALEKLKYFNDNSIFPDGEELLKILKYTGYSELELKIRLGIIDNKVVNWISSNPKVILDAYSPPQQPTTKKYSPSYETDYGILYQADCIDFMRTMKSDSIDLIFADPPFNLGKEYESGIDDQLSEEQYLELTEEWLMECIRILAPGGALLIYNLPYWQTYISSILNRYLNFRHWIAIYMRGLAPVARKLNPSHYGLLYYIKGEKPKIFNKQRIPMPTCRHCGGEIHDYGGKKKTLDPSGLSIADVWTDIHPVRHKKYKNREANELPLKLLYRVISMTTNEGDIVFDPFGGSGTTYVAAEFLKRKWIGTEIGDTQDIINRFKNNKNDLQLLDQIQKESNVLFTEDQLKLRSKHDFWTYEILQCSKCSTK